MHSDDHMDRKLQYNVENDDDDQERYLPKSPLQIASNNLSYRQGLHAGKNDIVLDLLHIIIKQELKIIIVFIALHHYRYHDQLNLPLFLCRNFFFNGLIL